MKMQLFWMVLAVILILLVGTVVYRKSVESKNPDAQKLETQEPFVSEPVAPGMSQDARTLPTLEPLQPGEPIIEINPRQRGASEEGCTTEAQTAGTAVSCQGITPAASDE